jgi:hypothetical protein
MPIKGDGEKGKRGVDTTIGDHHKVTTKAILNHRKLPQGYYKNHPKLSETTTRSPQKPSQTTIGDHHKVTAKAIPNYRKPPQSHRKRYPKQLETITRSLQDHHHKATSRSP